MPPRRRNRDPGLEEESMGDREDVNEMEDAIKEMEKQQKASFDQLERQPKTTFDLLEQLARASLRNQGQKNNYRGSSSGKGSHTYDHTGSQSHPHLHRPTMPQFMEEVAEEQDNVAAEAETFAADIESYQALSPRTQASVTFTEFFNWRDRCKPVMPSKNHHQNQYLQRAVGKLILPSFYGSFKCSAGNWVQKLDTYLQLNYMIEADAIKFATLNLEGGTQEWWYHGFITKGGMQVLHDTLNSHGRLLKDFIEKIQRSISWS